MKKYFFSGLVLLISTGAVSSDLCTGVVQKAIGNYPHCVDLGNHATFSLVVSIQNEDPYFGNDLDFDRSGGNSVGMPLVIMGKDGRQTFTDPSGEKTTIIYRSKCSENSIDLEMIDAATPNLVFRNTIELDPSGNLNADGFTFITSKGQFSCEPESN